MADNILLVEDKDQVELITLNRPRTLNAFNMDLLHALRDHIENLKTRRDVRVVIITGAGSKAFCTGADLVERAGLDGDGVKRYISTIRDLFASVESLNKPVIAAVNGIALGGGTELALACDIRIASTRAVFGLTETRLGVIPGAGGTQRLPRIVGLGKAKEMIFTGQKVDAEEAFRIGLVNKVLSEESLLEGCRRIALAICETAPIAIEQAKYAMNMAMDTDLKTGLEIESKSYWVTIPTEDRLEGLAAYHEKRKPVFKGK